MADYDEMRDWLTKNNVTHEQMNEMWTFMYDKYSLVKNLADHGINWTDLNGHVRASLIRLYEKATTAQRGE